MIIPNKFIKLDYNPTTDVLFIEWPNIHDYTLPELRYIINEIVETVKNYDIKHILADTSRSSLTVPAEEYTAMVNQLAMDLLETRLRKFARIITADSTRERIVKGAASLVVGSIEFKNFANVGEAMEWLTEK